MEICFYGMLLWHAIFGFGRRIDNGGRRFDMLIRCPKLDSDVRFELPDPENQKELEAEVYFPGFVCPLSRVMHQNQLETPIR